MKEVTVQAVPLDGDLYASECSQCGPLGTTAAVLIAAACQEHLREHGAVGIQKK